MLKNYFKIAFRNLFKNKLYSAINVLGLALGIAFSLLVLMFIHDELTYDQFHTNGEDIYRLYRQPLMQGSSYDPDVYMPMPTAQAMENDFPEVEETIRFIPFGANVIRKDGTVFEQPGFVFTDPSIFEVFTFPLLLGDPNTALQNPGSVVITEEIAAKYFGNKNPVGETLSIRLNGEFSDFEITGVAKNIPSNSTITFSVLLPIQDVLSRFDNYSRVENSWNSTRNITYIKLKNGTDAESVRAKMPDFMTTHMGSIFNEMREEGRFSFDGPPMIYQLQPLSDIHLNPEVPGGFTEPSNPTYSYILGAIALAVLLIACFNFMILSIGRSAKRAKEVGLRKVVGAFRGQLMAQFWAEALTVTFIALLTGLLFVEFLLPVFNELSGKELSFSFLLESSWAIAVFGMLFVLTGLIAGSYPALILSRFKPIESLKEKLSFGGANTFSKSLIMIQFVISIFLVAATLGMSNQLQFLQNKNLGFSGEQVVVIPVNGLDGQRALGLFQDALSQETGIADITGANVSFATGLWRRGYQYKGEIKQSAVFRVESNYINTLKMNLVAGRNFNPELASDSTQSIIVNETFLAEHGLDLSAVGESFPIDWGWMVNPIIIGVVEDFNYQSLENTIQPAIMYMNPRDPILNLLVRIQPDNMPQTIAKLRETWDNTITNEIPFTYSFLDEDMNELYRAEERWATIITYSSFFAIFVACLGLFGLASITSIQRQKEIGIRKVLGASIQGIVFLLSKDFAKLVAISILIATPVAWYALTEWLQNFAYRTEIGIGIFLVAGGFTLAVALLTVSWQSVKAALTNPVKSLRSE
ncbi:MAG: ABC transporter permease [Gracilimonas sp.]|uniref:ABC transporter permease n=1 Tax=Gracilimonas sp. TaxID=1974203 RepID=UPI0019A4C53D|nr:ABC transporter permease [Gracilimonas sp.]MBD3616744.1 ABC transporter permease [Gracilimonas sp.]